MQDQGYARADAVADMAFRLAAPAIRARRRQSDIFVRRGAAGGEWEGPAVLARLATSLGPETKPGTAASLLALARGLRAPLPWRDLGRTARLVAALCVMAAAGFCLVMSDAGPGGPGHAHTRHDGAAAIVDLSDYLTMNKHPMTSHTRPTASIG